MSETKYQIWMDSREESTTTGKFILGELQSLGMEVHVDNLGNSIDYLITGLNEARYVFQRKTSFEMIKPRKAFEDIAGMKMLDDAQGFLLLEGSLDWISKHSRMPPQPIIGGINSILLDWDTKIIPSPNKEWTPIWLYQLAKRFGTVKVHGKPLSLGESLDRELPLYEQARKILETFPGIGTKTAIPIMKRFGTLKNAIDNIDYWSLIDNISHGKVGNVKDVLYAQWPTIQAQVETIKSDSLISQNAPNGNTVVLREGESSGQAEEKES